jgi:4-hydroxy-tetrahydrodipicolinate reductase
MKKNIVLGTTGWQKDFNQIKELVDKSQIGLIYASNFSIGMQIFFKSVQQISNLLDKIDGYDIMLFEAHHKRKKDCPSGTALKLAEIILQNYSKKNDFSFSPTQENINSNILQISSLRGGEIIGIHSVIIDSLQDSIELIHSAKNRKGFAIGAILSCKWIYRKKGFYEINDMLNTIWKK